MVEHGYPEGAGAEEEARFVANMKRIREELGWSQGEFARRMQEAGWESFHQTTVSRIEKGERPVRLGEARGIARVLGALVGQMLLPSEEGKALRDLELSILEIRATANQICTDVDTFLFEKAMISKHLDEVLEQKVSGEMDEGIRQRRETMINDAKRWLSRSYGDVLDDYFDPPKN